MGNRLLRDFGVVLGEEERVGNYCRTMRDEYRIFHVIFFPFYLYLGRGSLARNDISFFSFTYIGISADVNTL